MTTKSGQAREYLPLIPAGILQRHRVWIPADTRYRAAARLLAALWREERGFKIGSYINEKGEREKLGSRVSLAAGNAGANFLTPEIFQLTRKELVYREVGALFDVERLACNLLSSMPAVNLLGPWASCLERAQGALTELLPAFVGRPTAFLFEHSPGRGDLQFTHDYTAFDALVRYTDDHDNSGFVAIEVKLTESMQEPLAELLPRYAELSETSELFHDHAAPALRVNPHQQLWREALLAQCMIDIGLYDPGYFLLVYHELNYHVRDAVETFQQHLREPTEGKVRLVSSTLEDVVAVIRLSDETHANALYDRYADWWKIDAEIEKHPPTFGFE